MCFLQGIGRISGKSPNKAQLIDLIEETLFECGFSVRRMEDDVVVGIVLPAVQK